MTPTVHDGTTPRRPARAPGARGAVWCPVIAALIGVCTTGAAAQGPLDVFSTHYGGARLPRIAPSSWFGVGSMLLTQFDARWDETLNDGTFINYDELRTTVGYNYATAGHQFVFGNVLPGRTALTLASSLHLGGTCDCVPQYAQDKLHNFLNVPHVARGAVDDGALLLGVDVEALLWPGRTWLGVGPHASFSTFHREIGASALGRFRWWRFIFAPQATAALVGSSDIVPSRVGERLDGGYWSGRATVEYAETLGFAVTLSEGIFIDENELLMSAYFTAELSPRSWLRLEFVNDLLNDKDRGPTGGGRIVWTFRY